jgi:quercetin dioxygenase-like cupin family protein
MATKHTYLKTHKLAGTLLTPDLGAEAQKLREKAAAASTGRAAKTLVKEGQMRATLVALKRGATLEPHAVEGVHSIQTLRGKSSLAAGGREVVIGAGELVVIGEGVQHSLQAQADSVLLITVAMSR